ncbi:MAG: hypothetical protein ABSB81_05365 [Halobacteriota archaeon]
MIFPDHCKEVAVRECDDKTSAPTAGEHIYFSSRYVLLFWQGKVEVYELELQGNSLIRTISKANRIAGFAETLVYRRKIDIFNRSKLIAVATRLCKPPIKTVVFQGFDLHWTFVCDPDLTSVTEIEVFDVSPPDPPYLITLIKKLNSAGIFGDLSVRFTPVIQDLRRARAATIYPCSASGIGSNCLNNRDIQVGEHAVLLGCDISKQVLEARVHGLEFEHVNICPTKTIRPSKPFIVKCCKSARVGPTELLGQKGYVVHWGANPYEVASAVRDLANAIR